MQTKLTAAAVLVATLSGCATPMVGLKDGSQVPAALVVECAEITWDVDIAYVMRADIETAFRRCATGKESAEHAHGDLVLLSIINRERLRSGS